MNGTCLQTFTEPTGVYAVAFSPDGLTVAAGSADVNGNGLVEPLERQYREDRTTAHRAIRYRDGAGVLPGWEDHRRREHDYTIMLWSVNGGPSLLTFIGHDGGVSSLAFSADGGTLISASWDETIKLWQVSDATCLLTFSGASASVNSVALSPDGQTLATGGDDGSVTLWNVSDGSSVQTLRVSSEPVMAVAFSPDGQTLACGCVDAHHHLVALERQHAVADLHRAY